MALFTFSSFTVPVRSAGTLQFQPVVQERNWRWKGAAHPSQELAQQLADTMADSLTFDLPYAPQTA